MTLLSRRSRFFLVVAAVLAITAVTASNGLWTGLLWAQSESGTTVSLTPSTTTVKEGETAELTVTMSPAPEEDHELTYTIGTDGDETTADADADDYTTRDVVTIPAGADGAVSSSAVISIEVTDDSDIDDGARETMVVRLAPFDAARSADSGGVSVSAKVIIHEGICDRTLVVWRAIVDLLPVEDCWAVTDTHLRNITGELNLSNRGIVVLQERDFFGLSELDRLRLENNGLSDLPQGIFEGLYGLEELYLQGNPFITGPDATLHYKLVWNGHFGFFARVDQGAPFDITFTLSLEGARTMLVLGDDGPREITTVNIPAGRLESETVEVRDFETTSGAEITATMASFPSNLPVGNYNGISAAVGDPLPMVFVPSPVFVSFKENTNTHTYNPDSVLEGTSNPNMEPTIVTYTVTVTNLEEGKHIYVDWTVGIDGVEDTNDAEVGNPMGDHEPHESSDFHDFHTPTQFIHFLGKGKDVELTEDFEVRVKADNVIDDSAEEYFVVTLGTGYSHQLGPVSTWRTVIKEGVCDQTQQVQDAVLQAQELSEQGLGHCSEVTDEDLASLTTSFALNHRGIENLKARDLIGMANLQSLRLDGNSLTDLPDGLFSNQSLLADLDLRNNKLGDGTLSENDFDDLGTLKTLRLDSNKIRTLPDNIFGHLDELSELNLGYNLLSDVPSGTFSEITGLQRLVLAGSSISSIQDGAFQDLSSLEHLDLQLNDAYRLSPGMFSGLSNLRTVNLYGNWIHTFSVIAELERVDEGIRVNVAEAAPFDMTVTLSAYGGTLSHDVVTVAAGDKHSKVVTVTTSKIDWSVPVTVESVSWDGTTFGMVPVPGEPLTVNP